MDSSEPEHDAGLDLNDDSDSDSIDDNYFSDEEEEQNSHAGHVAGDESHATASGGKFIPQHEKSKVKTCMSCSDNRKNASSDDELAARAFMLDIKKLKVVFSCFVVVS